MDKKNEKSSSSHTSASNEQSTTFSFLPKVPPSFLSIQKLEPNSEEELVQNMKKLSLPSSGNQISSSPSDPFFVSITAAKVGKVQNKKLKLKFFVIQQLTKTGALKRCLWLELDVGASFTYRPGDAIGIICPNDERDVEKLVSHLKLTDLQSPIQISSNNSKNPIPPHFKYCQTMMQVLRTLDLRSAPKKVLLRVMAEYTTTPSERDGLLLLCSREGSEKYREWITQFGFIDLFDQYPSCLPPIERLLEHLPAISPRYYSACSSPLKDPSKLGIAFNVIQYETKEGQIRKGLCTSWLEKLVGPFLDNLSETKIPVGSVMIPIFLRNVKTQFHLPESASIPIVMIGPGTGVAPFVGFLEHRAHLQQQAIGEAWLFFGCRHESKDFIFREELENFVKVGVLSKLVTAFSRDVILEGKEKMYVQYRLREYGQQVCDMLVNKRAYFYLCG